MRFILLGASALLLAGCGGEEYQVPASEAFDKLSVIGTPTGLMPLPIGFDEVAVDFATVPESNFVKWSFTHGADDLGTIFAQVAPKGETASVVTVSYADGTAPGENWQNDKIRGLLKRQVQKLVVEAVDAKFEKRPFNRDIRNKVQAETAAASIGQMMKDVDKSMNDHIKREKQRDYEEASRRSAYNPADKSKPTTDFSKYN